MKNQAVVFGRSILAVGKKLWQEEYGASGRVALLIGLFLTFAYLNGAIPATGWAWLQRLFLAGVETFLFVSFLKRWRPNLWQDQVIFLMFTLIVVLTLLGVRLAIKALGAASSEVGPTVLSTTPVIAGGLLMGALISPTFALVSLTVLTLGLGWGGSQELPSVLRTLVGGWIGILLMTPLRDRQQLIRGGLLLSLMMAGLDASYGVGGEVRLMPMLNAVLWGVVSGVVATALYWLGTALLERPFRLATPMVLLELSSPDHPLLRRLREEAPGTYAHSLNVGVLAEAAAQAIGADPLLARVGGYYHDIGKLKRPSFFIENQSGINTHDRLTPNLSAVIIAAHARDGVELARAYRLPTRVCEIIAQHHGTCLITYFYHQALANGEADPLLEQHFRYEGPKPRSREAALVMLADTVEAAGRSLESPTPARLSNLVRDMIELRRADGQLDESELNFRDLPRIQEAFVKVLSAIHHQRLDYAEVKLDEYILTGTPS